MRRTITMKRDDHVSYCNKTVDYLVTGIRNHFQIRNSRVYKYVITITEGGQYRFTNASIPNMYMLWWGKEMLGIVCKNHFHRIFFKPGRKGYNITVEKVRIKKEKKS